MESSPYYFIRNKSIPCGQLLKDQNSAALANSSDTTHHKILTKSVSPCRIILFLIIQTDFNMD